MSGYNMEYFLGDFAERTIDNLRFIENGAEQYSLFEVTQLMNSLLGLIIIPVENYKRIYRIKDRDLKNTSEQDYDAVVELIKKCEDEKRFYSDYENDRNQNEKIYVSNFINHIRNAIAHGGNNGIHFYPVSENNKISDIIFYDNNEVVINKRRRSGQVININEFCLKLSVSELKELVTSISNLYCKFEKRNAKTKEKQEQYNSDIEKLKTLLKKGRSDKTKVIFEFEESEIF